MSGCLALLMAACGGTSGPTATPGVVAVVAIENVWGDIARQIGGSHVRVTSVLTDPTADPHTFDADPSAAAAISNASFVIENGLGYDAFADRLLRASSHDRGRVLSVATVVGAHRDANPHLWYDPHSVQSAAAAIAAALSVADSADKASFAHGLRTFLASYQPYVDTVARIKARYARAPVAYTERVPGYLVEAAGLTLATPATFAQAVEDGTDPTPSDVATVDRALTSRAIKVLLYNAQVTSPTTDRVKKLATAHGVPVVGVSETLPAGEPDFQTWQHDQAKALLAALGG